MTDEKTYEFIGSFDLQAADSICHMLEEHNIDFELEIDDSSIRNLNPFQASIGGTYGSGVVANIYVEAQSVDRCNSLLNDIK